MIQVSCKHCCTSLKEAWEKTKEFAKILKSRLADTHITITKEVWNEEHHSVIIECNALLLPATFQITVTGSITLVESPSFPMFGVDPSDQIRALLTECYTGIKL